MTVLGMCRRPRASAGWVRGPPHETFKHALSAHLVPSAEFATPGLGVLVIDDPECLKVKVQVHYEDSVETPAFLKIQTVLIVHWESWQKDYHHEDSTMRTVCQKFLLKANFRKAVLITSGKLSS